MKMLFYFHVIVCLTLWKGDAFKIVSIVDDSYLDAPIWIEQAISESEKTINKTLTNTVIQVAIMDESSAEQKFCQALSRGVSLVVDLTGGGWVYGKTKADSSSIPYTHIQISVYLWMQALDNLLRSRNATDAALIFSNEALLDQALYYLVEGSVVRVIVLSGIDSDSIKKIKKLRPAPTNYVMFGSVPDLSAMLSKAIGNDLVSHDSQWTVVITTPGSQIDINEMPSNTMLTIIQTTEELCCIATMQKSPCSCTNINVNQEFILHGIETILRVLKELNPTDQTIDCEATVASTRSTAEFTDAMLVGISQWPGMIWIPEKSQMKPQLSLDIEAKNSTLSLKIGTWSVENGLLVDTSLETTPVRRYMKVGTIIARPWFYIEDVEPTDGKAETKRYVGYCVELTKKLAERMNFDYDFVLPPDRKYGSKQPNGTWNGMIGDLARGETDIIVAPLTMTSEREEVVDFVSPYFDQSGISIVIRKREREENLFKFMTVLKAEVWASIVAALVVTGIMIWFLDKYSPYSAQNNPDLQKQPYRKFTLKESFWFALTSFTPQGGGEAPKALSGRTLVAAYWLFVVLMLATFTANLAAFLTVERMQSPVQTLEALAKQAKIDFTTEKDTSMYEYFSNMAQAEEELFRVWKHLTLNSTSDQSKYRVWDYPIKEQYTHIKQIIDKTGPVASAREGLDKVVKSDMGEFAFIHDAAELRYEVYEDCRLIEIGEPFAEQPYAIAVQQGSHLQDEISRAILDMQKNRYFEALTAKFWNSSRRAECPNESDSEGITLQSLGGVFIATLVGLVLALIALAAEVMYYRQTPDIPQSVASSKMHHFKTQPRHLGKISVSPAF